MKIMKNKLSVLILSLLLIVSCDNTTQSTTNSSIETSINSILSEDSAYKVSHELWEEVLKSTNNYSLSSYVLNDGTLELNSTVYITNDKIKVKTIDSTFYISNEDNVCYSYQKHTSSVEYWTKSEWGSDFNTFLEGVSSVLYFSDKYNEFNFDSNDKIYFLKEKVTLNQDEIKSTLKNIKVGFINGSLKRIEYDVFQQIPEIGEVNHTVKINNIGAVIVELSNDVK